MNESSKVKEPSTLSEKVLITGVFSFAISSSAKGEWGSVIAFFMLAFVLAQAFDREIAWKKIALEAQDLAIRTLFELQHMEISSSKET